MISNTYFRGGGSSRSGGHSSSHGWGHPESGSNRNQGHGDGSGPVCPGSNGSTLRKQRPSRHSQPTPPGGSLSFFSLVGAGSLGTAVGKHWIVNEQLEGEEGRVL